MGAKKFLIPFRHKDGNICAGYHREHGPVIYDQGFQSSESSYRFWIFETEKEISIPNGDVTSQFRDCERGELQLAVEKYFFDRDREKEITQYFARRHRSTNRKQRTGRGRSSNRNLKQRKRTQRVNDADSLVSALRGMVARREHISSFADSIIQQVDAGKSLTAKQIAKVREVVNRPRNGRVLTGNTRKPGSHRSYYPNT